jgi:hypothetical protein
MYNLKISITTHRPIFLVIAVKIMQQKSSTEEIVILAVGCKNLVLGSLLCREPNSTNDSLTNLLTDVDL